MTDNLAWLKIPGMRSTPLLVLLLLGLFLFQGGGGGGALAADQTSSAAIAWSERDGQGMYRLRFSQHDGTNWTGPTFLSTGKNEEILPAVAADERGGIWVAWTELRGVYGTVRYRIFREGSWSVPAELETPTLSDLAPSLAVDSAGVAWLAFSGSDGRRDCVFVARWQGMEWGKPEQVNQNCRGPELRPKLVIGYDGAPVVIWQGFAGTGYQTSTSRLTPKGWTAAKFAEPRGTSPHGPLSLQSRATPDDPPPYALPSFVTDPTQAAILPFQPQP